MSEDQVDEKIRAEETGQERGIARAKRIREFQRTR